MGNRGVLFDSRIGDRNYVLPLINNYSATTNPGSTNDSSQGYTRGSTWLNQSSSEAFMCTVDTVGAAVWDLITTGSATPGQLIAPAASTTTGNGSAASVLGGAGGSTSGNGGSAIIQGGQPTSGVAGSVRELGVVLKSQGAAAVLNATGTLTAANLLAGIITSTAVAAVAATLPLATAVDTAIPDAAVGDSFEFSVINTSTTGADTFTIGTATGWTLVGSMVITPVTAGGTSGRFRAAKTAAGAWTLFRLS
jgi:hypothetical protein